MQSYGVFYLSFALCAYIDKSLHQGTSYAEYHTKLRLKYMRSLPSDTRKVKPPGIKFDFPPTYNLSKPSAYTKIARLTGILRPYRYNTPAALIEVFIGTHSQCKRKLQTRIGVVAIAGLLDGNLTIRNPTTTTTIAMAVVWGWRRNKDRERERYLKKNSYKALCVFFLNKTRCLRNQCCP